MADRQQHHNQDIRHRDLSCKDVSQMSREEKLELKRRLEEFVTAMRRGETSEPLPPKQAKPVKWTPRQHRAR